MIWGNQSVLHFRVDCRLLLRVSINLAKILSRFEFVPRKMATLTTVYLKGTKKSCTQIRPKIWLYYNNRQLQTKKFMVLVSGHRVGHSSTAASLQTSKKCSMRKSKFFPRSNFLGFPSWRGLWRLRSRLCWSAFVWGLSAGSDSNRCRLTRTTSASSSGDLCRTKIWYEFYFLHLLMAVFKG